MDGPSPRAPHARKKKKQIGAGLSLERFASAKKSTYDPRVIKEKQQALNAKKVNKYKKLKERLKHKLQPSIDLARYEDAAAGADAGRAAAPRAEPAAEPPPQQQQGRQQQQQQRRPRPPSRLERLAARAGAEAEGGRAAREARAAAAAERAARLEADAARRRALNKAFRKQTPRGQPVMKARIGAILQKLEGEQRRE